jgi:hypothetical protein
MRGLVYRVAGPPPDKNTPRSERLRWIRRLNWRCCTPFAALGVVLLLLWVPWYFAAAAVAIQAYTLMSISVKIRREERKEPELTGG